MIEIRVRTVYYSPRRRRHFMTAGAAANAEAAARMLKLFPTDPGCWIDGDDGWHWRGEPRLQAVYERLAKRYLRQFKAAQAEGEA